MADKTGKTTKRNKKPRISRKARNISIIILIIMMLVAGGFLVMLTLVDAFPADMLTMMIGVLAGLLVVSGILLFMRNKWLRGIGMLLAVVLVVLYGTGIYYMKSTYAMFSKISAEENAAVDAEAVEVTEKPFNIYITGIDQWNEDEGLDLERSDVNKILTVNPVTKKIMLTSIPRDAYVPLHRTGTMDKLTHTGIYGVDETLNTVHDWTGLDLNYYVKANFDACVDLVDAIGGIDIDNPEEFTSAITEHLYPKGKIHLKGYGALYYARERKAFEGEDQLRVRNQLRVVKAILDKVLSSKTLLTSYGDIMDVLGKEIETNMPTEDIQALVKMQLSDMRKWKIESQRMSGEYEMEVVASMDASNKYLVLKVSDKTFKKCMKGIDKIMNPTQEELDAIATEEKRTLFKEFVNKVTGRGDSEEAEDVAAEDQE